MPDDFGQWERVASELRAYREAQQQAWGDVDNATLGRYLAGDVTDEERRQIETALHERPELRKLTDLVSDVLRDCGPVAEPARPGVLPFVKPQRPSRTERWPRWAAVAAAACLLLALGYSFLPTSGPRFAGLQQPAQPRRLAEALPPGSADPSRGNEVQTFVASANNKPQAAGLTGMKIDPVALAADGLYSAGAAYEKHGDLDMAAFSYQLAYNLRDSKLGPNAEATIEARRNLGDVYQTALALADDRGEPQPAPAPPDLAPKFSGNTAKDAEVRNSAAELRQRITRQAPREVRKSVVPVLMQNLREAKTLAAREKLGLALAELGQAADDAVPVLQECLQKAQTPQERAVVLRALGELGQTAGPAAAPVLVTAMKTGSPEERRAAEDALANYGPAARDVMKRIADGAEADRPEWRELNKRLLGVEGRIGVRDGAELWSVLAVKQGQKQVRELAHNWGVEVFAETTPNPAPDDAKAADKRAQELAVNGVYFVIHPSPVRVEVCVGEALRGQGFDDTYQARLRRTVEEAVSRQDFDEGLLKGLRFVAQFEAEKAKKAP